jgi:hypothetical protein
VIVSETRINFTAASANPLNRVMFYSPYGDQTDAPFGLQQDQVSSLFGHNHQVRGPFNSTAPLFARRPPSHTASCLHQSTKPIQTQPTKTNPTNQIKSPQDHKLRIFCRDRDPKVCEALRAAFRRWSERQAGWGKAQHSTPFKFRSAHGAAAGGGGPGAAARGGAGGGDGSGGRGEGVRASKRARSLNFSDNGAPPPAVVQQQQPQQQHAGQPPKQPALAAQQAAQHVDQRLFHSPIPE